MNNTSTVSAELAFKLVMPQQASMPLTARLTYSRHDPYAVRVAFHVGVDEAVEWIFARELLSAGAESAVGAGDVRVWPSGGLPGVVLNIELTSPFGQAHFEASADEVSAFLRRSYQIVPTGEESAHVAIEDELMEFLRAY